MNPIRESLLEKHHAATPALDRIRREVIAAKTETSNGPGLFATLWLELFVKARATWVGMAAIWLLLLVAHLATADGTSKTNGKASASRPAEMLGAWKERSRQMSEWGNELQVAPQPAIKPEHPSAFVTPIQQIA